MGIKKQKGTISVENCRNRIRLRWRYRSHRYSINLMAFNKANLVHAQKVALMIELDIYANSFDSTLAKYTGKTRALAKKDKTIVEYFEQWTSNYRQMDCNIHTNYNSVRNMLRKWSNVNQNNIENKLSQETFCASTYNRRLKMLKDFVKWLIKKQVWTANPLEDINSKKVIRINQEKRKPLSAEEIKLILDAFKKDTFTPKYAAFNHSHYYPFIYFVFKTGVRNAEAIGLRVSSIDTDNRLIYIKEVLARTLISNSSVERVRKGTKNGKQRMLPLTDDLLEVLRPSILGKQPDDLVFLSPKGKSIDDHNFQNRIFKPILKELGINERVLYACRHTFGSRCIDSGITPVMTAFLMGNNPETALRNYTHQISIPKELPSI